MDASRRPLFLAFAGLFGLLIGSFLNVCIFRLPRRCMSVADGRSKCPRCRNEIAWYDNIPVVSWLLLGGKCRYCDGRISPRYMFVELLTGALIAWAAYVQLYHPSLEPVQRITLFVIQCYLVMAIVVSTFIDIDFEILPDEINLSGLAFGLVAGAAFPEILFGEMPRGGVGWLGWLSGGLQLHAWGLAHSVVGAIVGAGAIYAVSVFGTLLFRRRVRKLRMGSAMGMGDVKYLGFLGAFLGWQGIMLTFLVSVLAGALFGIGKALVTLRTGAAYAEDPARLAVRLGSRAISFEMGKVPFGPFISLGALAVLFARPQLLAGLDAYLNLFRR